jgi:predicted PurR-regulated permease PerM
METTGTQKIYQSLVILTIITLGLYFAGTLIMPIIFSGFVAVLLNPVADFMERLKFPRGLASLIAVLLGSVFIVGLFIIVLIQSQEIIAEVPQLIQNNSSFLVLSADQFENSILYEYIQEHSGIITDNLESIKSYSIQLLQSGLIGFKDAIVFLITCPIYIFFMLFCKQNIYNFFTELYEKRKTKHEGENIIKEVKSSLFNYLKGLSIVMLITGTLTFLGLYFLGIEYALFLGALTALLTPIPYIGVFISALIPIFLAVLTKDSLWYAGGVIGIFGVVQFLEGYVVTPKVMSESVNINPFIIVLGLIVFGSVIGFMGMVLTVPILAVIKVLLTHYPSLKAWELLLRDD